MALSTAPRLDPDDDPRSGGVVGRVSLILPLARASDLTDSVVSRCRSGLERSGYKVEVLAVIGPYERLPGNSEEGLVRWVQCARHGLASAAMAGLTLAEGDALLVLDLTQGYLPDDLVKIVEPIANDRADLVVAQRESTGGGALSRLGPRRIARGWVGRLALKILGTSDPFSGLVAIHSGLRSGIAGKYRPVGSRFAVDLLLRSKARREEVTVRTEAPRSRLALELDDLRHLKRLADDRFGNASRLLQFCAVGASGMVVDLSSYAGFQALFASSFLSRMTAPLIGGPLDLATAGAAAIAIALTWNFFLNRQLTFNDARFGSIPKQYLAYAMSNALGIALSLTLRLTLPKHFTFFQDHKLAAAAVGIVTATGISFSMARWVVFRNRGPNLELDATSRESPQATTSNPAPAQSFGH